MLKMFTYDEGWAGGFVVLAKNKEDAAEIMMDNEITPVEDRANYKKEILKKIEEHPVANGTCYHFMGDQ